VRVLVYPHTMEIGGSQLNAVEIAAAVRDRGHEVMVVSRPGALVEMVRQLGLTHVALDPRSRRRPSPRAAVQLTQLARRYRLDVVHGYEWPPTLEAFGGPRLWLGLPVVSTVMSARVAPFLPRTIPLIVGTEEIRRRSLDGGRTGVTLLEPPVDVHANAPGYDPGRFRLELGLDGADPLVVVVCRLVVEQKLEGLLAACDAVGDMAAFGRGAQLAVVGDGPARPAIEEAAASANARAGRRVIAMAGELTDPRPAYAAADVVLGMGGSALRAMAFGKPLVVQGEQGFWELVTPESAPTFLRCGWYGLGCDADGRTAGAVRLRKILTPLLADPDVRARLGAFGRSLVVERFSLDHAATVQEEVYAAAVEKPVQQSAARLAQEAVRSGIGVVQHQLRRKWQRRHGVVVIEDMNAVPAGGDHKDGDHKEREPVS
jgi:glycosyltransferase involved in cell wall biosynthesis